MSTIALALAVLAFAAQLIVSLAQAQGSSQQLTQVERINSQTQSTLTEVRSTAHALLSNQSEQFNKVLSVALRTATASVVEEVADAAAETNGDAEDSRQLLDPDLIAERVERRLRRMVGREGAGLRLDTAVDEARIVLPDRLRVPIDSQEEARVALDLLSRLSALELIQFLNFVTLPRRDPNRLLGSTLLGSLNPVQRLLVDKDVYHVRVQAENRYYLRIADNGHLLIRLLMNSHSRQEWYREAVRSISQQPSLFDTASGGQSEA